MLKTGSFRPPHLQCRHRNVWTGRAHADLADTCRYEVTEKWKLHQVHLVWQRICLDLTGSQHVTTSDPVHQVSSAQGHSWSSSAKLLEELYHQQAEPDEFTRGAMVNSCGVSDEWQLSIHCLHENHGARRGPDAVSVNAAISACEGQNTWQLSIEMLATLPQQRLDTTILAVNSGISAFSWSQQWEDAVELLSLVHVWKLDPTEVTWNALAVVAYKSLQWKFCCWLLKRMVECQQPPDVLALEAALGACERSGVERHAAALLEALAGLHLAPCQSIFDGAPPQKKD